MKKKILTLLIALTAIACSLCAVLNLTACNASVTDEVKLKSQGDGYMVTGLADYSATNLVIPSEYNGKPVVGVAEKAFYHCENLKTVTIPDSVTEIGELSFGFCKYLNTIKIGNGVTEIGRRAFFDCEKLKTVSIPASVTSIGVRAFEYCNDLSKIEVNAANTVYTGVDNCIIEKASNTLIAGCKNSVIPSGGSVTAIAEGAFCGSEIKTVVIPDSVTEIGYQAFAYCTSLEQIVLSERLTRLENSLFFGCERLKAVTIPESIKSIGKYTFENCSTLETVIIKNGVTEIGEMAFFHCDSIKDLIISNKITQIDKDAFKWCNKLESVAMPTFAISYIPTSNLKTVVITSGSEIKKNAFANCTELANITIPDSVTTIGDGAFKNCNRIKNITVPALALNYITKTNLQTVVLTNGSAIIENAFKDCRNLMSVTIPKSVTTIGDGAFDGCYNLVEVYNLSDLQIQKHNENYGKIAYYALDVYSSLTNKSKLTTTEDGLILHTDSQTVTLLNCNYSKINLTIPDNVTKIGDYAFTGYTDLESIIIPDSVTSIGSSAFSGCTSLKSVTIGNGLIVIHNTSFEDCPIETATIPAIAASSIANSNLKAVVITSGINLEDYAFRDCATLESVTIPNSIAFIGNSTFVGCNKLVDVYYKGSEADWATINIASGNTPLTNSTIHYDN